MNEVKHNLPDRFEPSAVEKRISNLWQEGGHFKAHDTSTKPPFCVILPPPNVTGFLHLGHALDHVIQDCMVRWKRMSGFNALWLPGTDHAGIATQAVVEKELKKQNKTRLEMGREAFLEQVWKWKDEYQDRIVSQMKLLGDSCDWDRIKFTLDEDVSAAVKKVFVTLHKKGLIYRGLRLVNWSGPLETAISDLEVEYKQVKGSLWTIRYPLVGGGHLLVATTRPETLLGDTALAVHPKDERYLQLIGKKALVPFLNREIPIIADEKVEKDFGTGVVKITPAHDFNDYQMGKTHKLPMINILDTRCRLNSEAGPYQGLSVQEARKRVLADLTAQNLLDKEEPHSLNVGHCSRSGAVVEPFLSEQWFVKMEGLAAPAKRAVESGTTEIQPESWVKVYLHWLNNIEDWCVSRQLWWGHRIPAWHCQDCEKITVKETEPESCEHCGSKKIEQDTDVLDTWFSSALWPFSTLGWPKETEAMKTFYPTSVLVTGHDILFFWVARMMMMGIEFTKDVPFRKVFLHGIVRDSQGRKMSKSLGNSVDPVSLIEKHGADALRFSILAHVHSGKDLKFSEDRVQGYRNFMNKIWNAFRFSLGILDQAQAGPLLSVPDGRELSPFDNWIIHQLGKCTGLVEKALEEDRFSDAASAIYQFIWYDFCDWYIEFSKPVFYGKTSQYNVKASQFVLASVLNRICRLLHPFAPFISEELYQKLPIRNQACITDEYPTLYKDKKFLSLASEEMAKEIELIKEIVREARTIRSENRISPAVEIPVFLVPSDDWSQKVILAHRGSLESLIKTSKLEVVGQASLSKAAVAQVILNQSQVQVVIPLEGLVDLAEEIQRIEKQLEKLSKDRAGLEAKLSNESFVKNADPDVVEENRTLLAQTKVRSELLAGALARLKN